MSEEIKEILEQLKDSVDYPKFDMPTFDGTDSEFIDNDTILEPDKCKLLLDYITNLQQKVEQQEKEIERLNNIINELEKYIHNELVLDFYNDDMPCELIINKMEKMIKELKENK